MATFVATISGLYRDLDNNSATDPTYDGLNPPARFEFFLNTTFINEKFARPDTIKLSGDSNASASYFGTIELGGNLFIVLSGTAGTRIVYGNASTTFRLPDTLNIDAIVESPKTLTEFDDNWSGSRNSNNVDLLGGNDIARGRAGADTISGDAGNDFIHGNGGNDHLFGGSGTDVIWGESGRDFLDGGAGKDDLDGGKNSDSINGGAGNDTLTGGQGQDYLNGGGGRDKLNGGAGNDVLVGGGKADRFIFRGDFGEDTIRDFRLGGKSEKVDLSNIGEIAGFKDLTNNHATQSGSVTIIDDGNGNTISLLNVAIGDLAANDFIFN